MSGEVASKPGYGLTLKAVLADRVDRRPRCWQCGKILAWVVTRPWKIKCLRCKADCSSPGFPEDMAALQG